MKPLRFFLFPLAGLYGFFVWIRNRLFDWRIFSAASYDLPLIGIGNLSTGGTGKSVVVDYLLHHFHDSFLLATLSRGYGRKTKGVRIGSDSDTAATLGDEPFQYLVNYPSIQVGVAESRVEGVQRLLAQQPPPQAILLDDVFQHRWVQPSLSILTTTYDDPFSKDFLLPVGNLREHSSERKRADIVLITKTPAEATASDRSRLLQSLKLKANQKSYFCALSYSKQLAGNQSLSWEKFKKRPFVLVTGIANTTPLTRYLKAEKACFDHLEFPDHYTYTPRALKKIIQKAAGHPILTTEKDYGRLAPVLAERIPLFYLAVTLCFVNKEEEVQFLNQIEHVLGV